MRKKNQKKSTKKTTKRTTKKNTKKRQSLAQISAKEPIILSNEFMIFSLLGCIGSILAYNFLGPAWSISFAVIFGFMFIASVISITPSFPKY